MLLDYFVTIVVQIKKFDSVYPESMWTEYISDMFAHSPLLCAILQGVAGWYAGELDPYMREGLGRRATVADARAAEADAIIAARQRPPEQFDAPSTHFCP
jgi:hypothetical protein